MFSQRLDNALFSSSVWTSTKQVKPWLACMSWKKGPLQLLNLLHIPLTPPLPLPLRCFPHWSVTSWRATPRFSTVTDLNLDNLSATPDALDPLDLYCVTTISGINPTNCLHDGCYQCWAGISPSYTDGYSYIHVHIFISSQLRKLKSRERVWAIISRNQKDHATVLYKSDSPE